MFVDVSTQFQNAGEEQMIVLPREQLTGMLPEEEAAQTNNNTNIVHEKGYREYSQPSSSIYGRSLIFTQTGDKTEWGQDDTRLLLRLYAKYLRNVGPNKQFRSKRLMWKKISDDIFEETKLKRTWVQCENRYKTILKRKATLQSFSRVKKRRAIDDEYNKTMEMVHRADADKVGEKSDNFLNEIISRPKRRSKYDIDPSWVVPIAPKIALETDPPTPVVNPVVTSTKTVESIDFPTYKRTRKKIKESKDEFGIFGKFVANKLRHLPSRKQQLVAQRQIHELLYKLEMDLFDDSSKDLDMLDNASTDGREGAETSSDLQNIIDE